MGEDTLGKIFTESFESRGAGMRERSPAGWLQWRESSMEKKEE
jgi:hypothetical protein